MRTGTTWVFAVVLTPALACLLGCGGGTVRVKGAVTFDGKPVDEGSISFESADGKGPSLGGKIEAGRYEVAGDGGAGKKVVRIRGTLKTGRKVEAGPPVPKGVLVDEIKGPIPAVYNDKSTTVVELKTGKVNEHDFPLVSVK
jgi:hypothetical protein